MYQDKKNKAMINNKNTFIFGQVEICVHIIYPEISEVGGWGTSYQCVAEEI